MKNVSLFFGKHKILSNINAEFKKNRVTAIIGKSGCGKTSLLRCINRMNDLTPGSLVIGEILFDNQNINSSKVSTYKLRTKIGMVFQRPNPFPFSVYKNITFGPRLQGIKSKNKLNKILVDSLENAGLSNELEGRLNESALNFSGGQQQRICIARAMSLRPKIILFDEPTSALDPIATDKVEELIDTLRKDYTIILVTHSLKQALRLSDYVMFLEQGRLVEYNSTQKILVRPIHKLTKSFIYSAS